MKLVIRLSILFTTILLTSCDYCKLWGVTSLGNNFAIVESDKDNVAINYCTSQCCDSGIPVVPNTITEYNYDTRWIIAKSTDSSKIKYWIIDKKSKTGSYSSLHENILSQLIGPLDSFQFRKKINENKIQLLFIKYKSLQ